MPRSLSMSRSRSRDRHRSRSPSIKRSRSPRKRRSASPTEGVKADQDGCPFLIRLFVTKGKHTPMLDFDEGRLPVRDEFQVYGWKSSTPTSLIQLLLPSFPPTYRSPMARYSFRHIYVDASPRGLYRHKDLVSFTGRELMHTVLPDESSANGTADTDKPKPRGMDMDMELDDLPSRSGPKDGASGPKRKVEEKTLDEYGFVTGDLLSVSLFIPEPRGLRRPTVGGAGPAGADGPGLGGPGQPPGPGRGDFGWSGGPNPVNVNGARTVSGPSGADQTGPWERGAPLPPQNAARAGAGESGRGAGERDGGGRWGRGGAPGGGAGMGIRGAGGRGGEGRRSRSPDYRNGARSPEDRARGGDREDRRDGRRESWNTRR